MSSPWVFIDVSGVAYRAFHSVGSLDFEDIPTGVIFGFFSQLRQICMDPRVRSNRIAIFCDSKTSIRAKSYPQYKAKRKTDRSPEEVQRISAMYEQLNNLTSSVLPACGLPIYRQEGLESDDLMAYAAKVMTDQGQRAIIVTSDGDLFQCISEWVHWFDPQRNIYYTPESFLSAKGIECSEWGNVKAIAGCKTDNVSGVPGVGEITAIHYLNGDLPTTYQTHKSIVSSCGLATASRNSALVVLPHNSTKPFDLVEPKYDVDEFFKQCKKYGLASIIRERKAWESFLHGAPFRTRKRGEK